MTTATTTTTDQNKQIVTQATEALNRLDWATADRLHAPHMVDHGAYPGQAGGYAGFKQGLELEYVAFPDWVTTIEDIVAEGDEVVTRWTGRGTHNGPLLGIPATGRPVEVTGMRLFRLAEGQIVETWVNWDLFGLMQQLGVIPGATR